MATTPYPFVSGATLTASQMNSLFNITTSTKTASYTLVAADAGTRIIMNSASATTITVNTSLFSASDVVEILNIGAGVCTITAGTATVATTGSLALAQNGSGRLVFTSASASFFDQGAVAQTASGLTLISATTIGSAVTSVTVSNAFSSTYDNYKITISGGAGSTAGGLGMQLGSTATGYYYGVSRVLYASGAASLDSGSNAASWTSIGGYNTGGLGLSADLLNPFLSLNTFYMSNQVGNAAASVGGGGGGFLNNTTSYTAFTITTSTGNITGGTIRVYGYSNS